MECCDCCQSSNNITSITVTGKSVNPGIPTLVPVCIDEVDPSLNAFSGNPEAVDATQHSNDDVRSAMFRAERGAANESVLKAATKLEMLTAESSAGTAGFEKHTPDHNLNLHFDRERHVGDALQVASRGKDHSHDTSMTFEGHKQIESAQAASTRRGRKTSWAGYPLLG